MEDKKNIADEENGALRTKRCKPSEKTLQNVLSLWGLNPGYSACEV